MTLPTLRLAEEALDDVAALQQRVRTLEALLANEQQCRAEEQTTLRHVATLASSATLACNGRDQFAQAQLRALSFLATTTLETP